MRAASAQPHRLDQEAPPRSMSATEYRMRRAQRDGRWLMSFAALVSAGWCASVHADETDLTLGISSSSVLRGVVLGDLTARSVASYSGASGWLANLGVAAMQSPMRHETWDAQLALKAGYARVLGSDWAWQAAYTLYTYPGVERLRRYAHHELGATLAYRDVLYLSLAALRTLRATSGENRSSVVYELVANQPLVSNLSATAGLGYREALDGGSDHAYGHAGLSWRLGRAQADLLYMATDAAAKRRLGSAAANRWVASVAWRF
jgi:hypothetical protein